MAKDPRFNFYPDNYLGGTLGFTLEQHGAYLMLIILQAKNGKFTEEQAKNHLASFTFGNTAVYTKLWNFLIPKFQTDGTYYWSGRLDCEIEKSKKHSELQSDRIKKRWKKSINGNTAVLPDNRNRNEDISIIKRTDVESKEDGIYEKLKTELSQEGEPKQSRCMTISREMGGIPKERADIIHDGYVTDFVLMMQGAEKWEGMKPAKEYFVRWMNLKLKTEKEKIITEAMTPKVNSHIPRIKPEDYQK